MLMQLGDFQFSIATMTYDELQRTTLSQWARQTVINQEPVSAYIAPGDDVITLRGVCYPQINAPGRTAVNNIRELLQAGKPLTLFSSADENTPRSAADLGEWYIERLDVTESLFLKGDGVPRRQAFTIALRSHNAGTV